jgi:hypothetical protein
MLTTKLVVRALDAGGALIGWAEATGEARGDGNLTVTKPTLIALELPGVPVSVSVHWADVNVAVTVPVDTRQLLGRLLMIPGEWVALVCGPMANGLPPVTVSTPVTVGVPVGSLGARAN